MGGKILDFTWQSRSTEDTVSEQVVLAFQIHAAAGRVVHANPWKV